MGSPAAATASEPSPSLAVTFTLYGSATQGWGDSPSNMTTPGPTLTAYLNQSVTMVLYSADGGDHEWFLDLNGNGVVDAGEPDSGPFNGTTAFGFVPFILGIMVYRCAFHPTTMYGTFEVDVGDRTPPTVKIVSPLNVPVSQPIPVQANVSDPSGIQEAILYYTIGVGAAQWAVMNGTGAGIYSAVLPAQPGPTYVAFFIQAIDGAGNSGRSPANGTYTITVGPPNVVPLPTTGLGPPFLGFLVAIVAVGAAAVIVAAWRFGRRPPGTARGERPDNP